MTGATIREAGSEDGPFLLCLRNDPDTVAFSVTGRRVEPDEHESWLSGALTSARTSIWVAEVAGRQCGQVRLDRVGGDGGWTDGATLDIAVHRTRRGQGLARDLLAHAKREAIRRRMSTLMADVAVTNVRSLRLFQGAGFTASPVASDSSFARLAWAPMRSYCFASGVEAGRVALEALLSSGPAPELILGYDETLSSRSGFADLRDLAATRCIPHVAAADINGADVEAALRRWPCALLVVAGWSQIVKPHILDMFDLGGIGLHPTRLPLGRGRAPIPWTLIKGLRETAVSLFTLEQAVDTGSILDVEPIEIDVRDDAASLYTKVATAHATILTRSLPRVLAGTAEPVPQKTGGEAWPRRRPDDGRIDWSLPAESLYDWVRGLTRPYPGAFVDLRDAHRITVWSADHPRWAKAPGTAAAGTVLGEDDSTARGGVAIACGDGGVLVLRCVSVDGGADQDGLSLLQNGTLVVGGRCG